MADFLQQMAAASHERAALAKRAELTLARRAADASAAPALDIGSFGVIAEVKRRSPAEGVLAATSADSAACAVAYESAGAAAVSVLTEPQRFDGSLDDLSRVCSELETVPAMRKDFVVDAVQVVEARACGAGGILLIAAILDDRRLAELVAVAREFGMFVLLEAFARDELKRCTRLVAQPQFAESTHAGNILIGINTRDLRSLKVNPDRLRELSPDLPPDTVAVAESGVLTGADATSVAQLGYRAVLVGTALMRAADPRELLQAMRQAGARGALES